MKVALLGDLHRGYGYSKDQGSEDLGRKLEKSQDDFFDLLLIPYLEENGITDIIQTGDVYEQEYVIDSRTTSSTIDLFKIKLKNYKVHAIIGNHDIYYNDRRDINSLKTIENLPNVTVWSETSAMNVDGRDILLCPWLVKNEHEKLEKYLGKKKPDIVIGHFDIKDMDMYKGRPSMQGFHVDTFTDNVKLTISGHYHTKSEYTGDNGNKIIYVGTPYGLSHNDDDDPRGFWILDTDTLEMTFIENNVSRKFTTISSIEQAVQCESLSNYFVRILADSSMSTENAVLFRKAIDEKEPHHTKTKSLGSITGPFLPIESIKHDSVVAKAISGDDIVDIANDYIKVLKLDEDTKTKMSSMLNSIREDVRGKKSGK